MSVRHCGCRNAWANYYQYMGQSIFLQHLQKVGSSAHVIFMDMDVLILDDIMEVRPCALASLSVASGHDEREEGGGVTHQEINDHSEAPS